jgi:phosphotransferase system enzyme I (PtsI)
VFALLGLGIRNLSVSPRAIANVKRVVRGVRIEAAQIAARDAMAAATAREAEVILRRKLRSELESADTGLSGLPTLY